MRKLKKLLSIAMSVGMIATSIVATMPANTVSATSITFKQGDANGDGAVTIADLTAVSQYLSGNRGATAQQITRMDATQNKVIEEQDYIMIYDCIDGYTTPQTVTTNVYTNIDDSARTYYVFDRNTTNIIGNYTLPANTSTSPISTYKRFQTTDDYLDTENMNTVRLLYNRNGQPYVGSGFIVDDHVIATAAHCLYNGNNSVSDLTVEVYNYACTEVLATITPKTMHIPQLFYQYHDTGYKDNYDYALIYVEEDLSQYGKWSLGCMTTEFMATGSDVIASGFTGDIENNKPVSRYYSCGDIINYSESENVKNDKNLRFTAEAMSYSGKSGGPAYYESDYDETTIRTVVGIVTGGGLNNATWATRITPTLLKFYLNNSNIETYLPNS